ncbi:MAG: hypothetical protein DMF91_06550 [Acidobacteria bacterium]|nr:MAG: hypothetical protein DMF91_06550 [Acidobacteriota bacterium]
MIVPLYAWFDSRHHRQGLQTLLGRDDEITEMRAARQVVGIERLQQCACDELPIFFAVCLIDVEPVVDDQPAPVMRVCLHESVLLQHVGAEEVSTPVRVVGDDRVRIANLVTLGLPAAEPRGNIQEGAVVFCRVPDGVLFDKEEPIARLAVRTRVAGGEAIGKKPVIGTLAADIGVVDDQFVPLRDPRHQSLLERIGDAGLDVADLGDHDRVDPRQRRHSRLGRLDDVEADAFVDRPVHAEVSVIALHHGLKIEWRIMFVVRGAARHDERVLSFWMPWRRCRLGRRAGRAVGSGRAWHRNVTN